MRLAALVALLVALGTATAARAQAPANAPAARAPAGLAPFVDLAAGPAVPDTTAPWRYVPLVVGSVWEYEVPDGHIKRSVVGDTTALGFRYAILTEERLPGTRAAITERSYLRFDTLSSTVRTLFVRSPSSPSGPSAEDGPSGYGCPLDAPFGGVVVECSGVDGHVDGTYEGALVFGAGAAGTGTDTVFTAVKRFALQGGFVYRLAADVGDVFSDFEGHYRALTFYQIGDVQRGVRRFPTSRGPDPEAPGSPDLRVWPHPARSSATVAFGPAAVGRELRVVDVRGRVVLAPVAVGPGRGSTVLDVSGLAPGVYAVEIGAAAATRFVGLR